MPTIYNKVPEWWNLYQYNEDGYDDLFKLNTAQPYTTTANTVTIVYPPEAVAIIRDVVTAVATVAEPVGPARRRMSLGSDV